MSDNLQIAIEKLYSVFSVYPYNSTIEGCPYCISNTDQEKIHSKQLTELAEEDLARYTAKAMTTWGSTADFKHYLPRILELLATTDFIVDTFVVLGKLSYGRWRTWPVSEQAVIEKFLYSWWENLVRTKSGIDKETFIEIYKLTKNVDQLLESWTLSFHDHSFSNYVDFIYKYYFGLKNKGTDFKEIDLGDAVKITDWIKLNTPELEAGFFYFEATDRAFAERISTALYMLERI